jgi:hypothetical protein
MYPPIGLTAGTLTTGGTLNEINSWTSTVTGATYGNGVYKISASSIYIETGGVRQDFWELFKLPSDDVGGHWANNYVNGAFKLAQTSRYTLDSSTYGDWVTVQLPYNVRLTKCVFGTRGCCPGRAPSIFKIYGSNNGVNWVVIHDQTTALPYSGDKAFFAVRAQASYSYIGLVVTRMVSTASTDEWINLGNWQIFGVEQVLFDAKCVP